MKQQLQKVFLVAALVAVSLVAAKAQTVSTFETLTIPTDSFWNGMAAQQDDTTFTSGNIMCPTTYNHSFSYWAAGWAISSKKDSTTVGFTNLYAAMPATGYNSSSNYIVGSFDVFGGKNVTMKLTGVALGKAVKGFYVTNGTFATMSMRHGDLYAKKFGDTTGTHSGLAQGSQPDWFKLTVRKYLGGVLTNDSVEFYLADFRFANNAQDYIVTNWRWVDLTALGNVDSLAFHLSSSDNTSGFMNTPAYFCIDNFTTADVAATGINNVANENTLQVYPNPCTKELLVTSDKLLVNTIEVADLIGRIVFQQINKSSTQQIRVDVSTLPNGIYFIKATDTQGNSSTTKFVKQ
ncbi:MAG: hypothetical protein RL708_2606 [Bacteroidota bacterium]|jgi:hypothetical protein